MAEFVAESHLAFVGEHAHTGIHQGYVLRMLHRPLGGGHIAHPAPAIGAEVAFQHRDDVAQDVVCGIHAAAVPRHIAYNGRIGAIKPLIFALYDAPVGGGDTQDIGRDGLFHLPHAGVAAVGMGHLRLPDAAADSAPAGLGSHLQAVGGLVVEIVSAREHAPAKDMWYHVEHSPKIVINMFIHVHAAEAVRLHIPVRHIGHRKHMGVARLPAWHIHL